MSRKSAVFALLSVLMIISACGDGVNRSSKAEAKIEKETNEAFDPGSPIIPEYESRLEAVIMHAIPDIKVQEPLIRALPEYTRIILLTPDYIEKSTRNTLNDMDSIKKRISLLVYGGDLMWRGYWAQDMFQVLATNRTREIILPDFYTFDSYYDWLPLPYEPTQETDGFLFFLSREGYRSRTLSGYFEGGNLNYDRFNGMDILFAGSDNFIDKDAYREYNFLLDEGISLSISSVYLHGERLAQAQSEYGAQFGADRVLILGDRQYTTQMFHIDQCFVETGPGEVVLMDLSHLSDEDIDDVAEDFSANFSDMRRKRKQLLAEGRITYEESLFLEKFVTLADRDEVKYILTFSRDMLEQIREELKGLGYRIHRLPQDPYQNLFYQSYANSVVFTDRVTGHKKILMPIFPDIEGNYDAGGAKNRKAIEFFESIGLEVIPVVNYTWASGGNNNCLINVYK